MRKEKIKVSVILCAYNEEKNAGRVVGELLKCPTVQELIVVNDGSTDGTKKILRSFGKKIRLISYRKNRGKGYALYCGIRAARGEVVVFLDADLKNLKEKHLVKLTEPIILKKANYVIAHIHPPKTTKANLFSGLTGQRAYLKRLLTPHLSYLKKSRYGVEIYLNSIFPKKWGKTVYLPEIDHLIKHQKMTMGEALPSFLQEAVEISKAKLEIKAQQHKQLQKILNPKEIKSIKLLRGKVNEIKDKEVSELIKAYIIPQLKKLSKG